MVDRYIPTPDTVRPVDIYTGRLSRGGYEGGIQICGDYVACLVSDVGGGNRDRVGRWWQYSTAGERRLELLTGVDIEGDIVAAGPGGIPAVIKLCADNSA